MTEINETCMGNEITKLQQGSQKGRLPGTHCHSLTPTEGTGTHLLALTPTHDSTSVDGYTAGV